jgi:hypothetical protein
MVSKTNPLFFLCLNEGKSITILWVSLKELVTVAGAATNLAIEIEQKTNTTSTTDGTMTLQHTSRVTTHFITYHLFDLHFK